MHNIVFMQINCHKSNDRLKKKSYYISMKKFNTFATFGTPVFFNENQNTDLNSLKS